MNAQDMMQEISGFTYLTEGINWTSQVIDHDKMFVVWEFNGKLYSGEFSFESKDNGLFVVTSLEIGNENLVAMYSRNSRGRHQFWWTHDFMAGSHMDNFFRQVTQYWVILFNINGN